METTFPTNNETSNQQKVELTKQSEVDGKNCSEIKESSNISCFGSLSGDTLKNNLKNNAGATISGLDQTRRPKCCSSETGILYYRVLTSSVI